ncbi:LptF/LptG family permease [Arenibaculum pallidiluteum]|uniref:LptF/LptG family permease n=1 Tax=Arenibaculum pallidiluteum TaxID=2812559 RepID=UPI001A9784D9|nr:LptF/LptG family permease [Arenibaculum pallidiluteum]
MTLTRYFTRAFGGRFLAVLLALASLLQLLDLLDKASQVLERGHGMADLLTYVALNLPLILNQLVPLAVLVGAVTAFMSFVQHNEVTALRAAGASPLRLLGVLLPAVAVIVALHLLLMGQVAPRAEQALQDWWAQRPAPAAEQARPPARVWMRVGSSIVSVGRILDGGHRLEGVTIVTRDDQGRATGRTVAREARWDEGRQDGAQQGAPQGAWTLYDAETLSVADPGRTERRDALPWPSGPSPENLVYLDSPTRFLSMQRLKEIIQGRWSGLRDRGYYETQAQQIFAIPASSFVMLLLAHPALHGIRRSRTFGTGMAIGLGLGLLFLLFQGLLAALAQAGALPPTLAVWLPLALFGCIGGSIFLYLEE